MRFSQLGFAAIELRIPSLVFGIQRANQSDENGSVIVAPADEARVCDDPLEVNRSLGSKNSVSRENRPKLARNFRFPVEWRRLSLLSE